MSILTAVPFLTRAPEAPKHRYDADAAAQAQAVLPAPLPEQVNVLDRGELRAVRRAWQMFGVSAVARVLNKRGNNTRGNREQLLQESTLSLQGGEVGDFQPRKLDGPVVVALADLALEPTVETPLEGIDRGVARQMLARQAAADK